VSGVAQCLRALPRGSKAKSFIATAEVLGRRRPGVLLPSTIRAACAHRNPCGPHHSARVATIAAGIALSGLPLRHDSLSRGGAPHSSGTPAPISRARGCSGLLGRTTAERHAAAEIPPLDPGGVAAGLECCTQARAPAAKTASCLIRASDPALYLPQAL